MRNFSLLTMFLLALLLGCTVDDEDRCLSGYTWEPDLNSCRRDPDTGDDTSLDTSDTFDAGMDTDGDAGPDVTEDEGPVGMGEPCTADGNECAIFQEASYCAYDPTSSGSPGICTIKDCAPGECPLGYDCCDCFKVVISCVPLDGVTAAVEKGCVCS